ncbi:hypothetical protein [Chlorogloea sp. CCALA 695]|uniref:hypothetical protein n=1 Tax=Chlorogloea sp. CCALA 695 TaxID=2107693 RepID=UPI000D04B260|nr:hypothetical protein [Chlorogloea sp. CCALA 695]PSB27624.1 hypothetical protein C7B70_22115 [Chlorogloea sp. CCALA 695]
MSEKFEIRFSIQAEPGSPEFELLRYLKNSGQTLYPLRDMAMTALISHWLPLVYRDSKKATPQKLHQVIRDCTHRLMMQLQYFREMDEMAQEQNQLRDSTSNGQYPAQIEPSPPAGENETQYDPDDLFNN